jgi:hypothetical protein
LTSIFLISYQFRIVLCDIINAMSNLAKLGLELTMEEMNLLLVGYKKVTITKCVSLHVLARIELMKEDEDHENHMKIITKFHHKVDAKLNNYATMWLTLTHTFYRILLMMRAMYSTTKCDIPLSIA